MSRVIATGKTRGGTHTFVASLVDGKLCIECRTMRLDAQQQNVLNDIFMMFVKRATSPDHQYKPPENTLRAAFYAFDNGFFDDSNVKIEVEGELEPIPYEDGVIY